MTSLSIKMIRKLACRKQKLQCAKCFFSSRDSPLSATTNSDDTKAANPPFEALDRRRLYRYLQLESFTNEELDSAFDKIVSSSQKEQIDESQVRRYLEERIAQLDSAASDPPNQDKSKNDSSSDLQRMRVDFASQETRRFMQVFASPAAGSTHQQEPAGESKEDPVVTRQRFRDTVTEIASSVDIKRTWPITVSMLLVGSSVGVITPAMPFVVSNLGLTPGQYGLVVSAFALTKMTGNIPSAVLVERHGRKPYMVFSLFVVAFGVGGIGFASSFEELYLCRLMTGAGVAALSTAGTMMVTDLSTPLNRASTMAPIMSAFAAGTVLGPALGGYLATNVGINPTFYMVGASYFGLATLNNFMLQETKRVQMKFPWHEIHERGFFALTRTKNDQTTMWEAIKNAVGQWIPLVYTAGVRNVLVMNCFYWISLAGSQMTLLPLLLTDGSGFAMSATGVGQVYMGMSMVQVLGNPILARYVDRIGKEPAIIVGCTLISSSMAAVPFCNDLWQLAGALGLWAAGSTTLSTAPLAYISDQVDEKQRAQAIALLRTSGDVGFLIGAASTGALADLAGDLDFAMQSSAALLFTATTWFAARQFMNTRIEKKLR